MIKYWETRGSATDVWMECDSHEERYEQKQKLNGNNMAHLFAGGLKKIVQCSQELVKLKDLLL